MSVVLTALAMTLFAALAALLLYVRGIAHSFGEPFIPTLRAIIAALISREFF